MMKPRKAEGPTCANIEVGGIPALYYFDLGSKGRGEVFHLLFEDAGIAYHDTRVPFGDAATFKKEKLDGEGLNPTGSFPVIELNKVHLTQSYPTLRHLSRIMHGAYHGRTDEEKYFVDVTTDIVSDFRTLFVSAFSLGSDYLFAVHVQKDVSRYVEDLEKHLARRQRAGLFVLGSRLTYADLLIFSMIYDEGFDCVEEASHLKQLVESVRVRPNLVKYFESDCYFG